MEFDKILAVVTVWLLIASMFAFLVPSVDGINSEYKGDFGKIVVNNSTYSVLIGENLRFDSDIAQIVGVSPASIEGKVYGSPSSGEDYYTSDYMTQEGIYNATNNPSGNYTAIVNFDSTPPTILEVVPSGDSYLSGEITISCSGEDSGSGFDNYDIFIDGGFVINLASGETLSFDTTQHLDGDTYISIKAYDKAGLYTVSGVQGIIDNTPPLISVADYELES